MRHIHLRYANSSNSFTIKHRVEFGHFNMQGCHAHSRYELNYLIAGERYFFIKDRSFLINRGDLVLVNSNSMHKSADSGVPDPETIIIEFDKRFISNSFFTPDNLLNQVFAQQPVLKFNLNKQQQVENYFRNMIQEIKNDHPDVEFYLQSILQQLLIFLAQQISQAQPLRQHYSNPTTAKIAEVVQYMNDNFYQGLSLESVGSAFQINPSYLSRLFKNVTGFTFVEYLNSLRIQEAERLLRESDLSINAIANQIGFETQSHFGKLFKSLIGSSPLQYRKEIMQ